MNEAIEEKLETMADLEAFLKAAGCRMNVGSPPDGKTWLALITRDGYAVGTGEDEDFVKSIRLAVADAMVNLQKLRESAN
jgi:hypothetical protein